MHSFSPLQLVLNIGFERTNYDAYEDNNDVTEMCLSVLGSVTSGRTVVVMLQTYDGSAVGKCYLQGL